MIKVYCDQGISHYYIFQAECIEGQLHTIPGTWAEIIQDEIYMVEKGKQILQACFYDELQESSMAYIAYSHLKIV